MASSVLIDGERDIPQILYGTAFKEEETASLVVSALESGFKGVDSAAVTRAYQEHLVGKGVDQVLHDTDTKREDIFIQTKFSPYLLGKDPKFFPYDINDDIPTQVASSIASSLAKFPASPSGGPRQAPYLDCVVLHSPYPQLQDTLRAWSALESHVPHDCRFIGLSNIDIVTLRAIYEVATVKPAVIQNRFTQDIAAEPNPALPPGVHTPDDKYDAAVRMFCQENNILYQPWGLLWGNPRLLEARVVKSVAEAFQLDTNVALYLCFLGLSGTGLLIGTKNKDRMKGDLDAVKGWKLWLDVESNRARWKEWMSEFRDLLEPR